MTNTTREALAAECKQLVVRAIMAAHSDTGAEPSVSASIRAQDELMRSIDALAATEQAPAAVTAPVADADSCPRALSHAVIAVAMAMKDPNYNKPEDIAAAKAYRGNVSNIARKAVNAWLRSAAAAPSAPAQAERNQCDGCCAGQPLERGLHRGEDGSPTMACEAHRYEQAEPAPIDMVLHCPKCGIQHIDAPEESDRYRAAVCAVAGVTEDSPKAWRNPPHRSHLCHGCGHIWRPADVPTNGVEAVKTKGKADSPIAVPERANGGAA